MKNLLLTISLLFGLGLFAEEMGSFKLLHQDKTGASFQADEKTFVSLQSKKISKDFKFDNVVIQKLEDVKRQALEKVGVIDWKIRNRKIEKSFYSVEGSYVDSKGITIYFYEVQQKKDETQLIQFLVSSEVPLTSKQKSEILKFEEDWVSKHE